MFPHAALNANYPGPRWHAYCKRAFTGITDREKGAAMARRKSILPLALLAAAILLLSSCGTGQAPEPSPPPETPAATAEPTPLVIPEVPGYEGYELRIDGETCGWAYRSEAGLFLDPIPLLERCGLTAVKTRLSEDSLGMDAGERFQLTSTAGDHYLCVNERYFYAPKEFMTDGETAYLPAEVTQRLFHVTVKEDAQRRCAEIDTAELQLLEGGKYYYDVTFSGDDIYWLSHIIQAEADNQKLDAMIGVGNVVLNRTKTEGYPDTIFKVIFDYQNAPQFAPKQSRALSRMISPEVQIAAYLCLEGYNNVGSCLYFQNPLGVETTWISDTREYALTLGDLDFYY